MEVDPKFSKDYFVFDSYEHFHRLSVHATWADWKLFKDSFLTR